MLKIACHFETIYIKKKSIAFFFVFKQNGKKILVLCNTLFFNKSLESSTEEGNTGMFVLSPVTRQGNTLNFILLYTYLGYSCISVVN